MSYVTGVNRITEVLTSRMRDYSAEAAENIEKWANVITKKLLDNIKNASPEATSAYKKGWKRKVIKYYPGKFVYIIHNKERYQLSHLLEHGHMSRNGTKTPAKIHIKPFADEAAEEYEAQVIGILANKEYKNDT